MKKLRNKMIVGALVGVIALGGLFQVGGMGSVAYASSSNKVYFAREMRDFIMKHRSKVYLPKQHEKDFGPIKAKHYSSLDEFKNNILGLQRGWYMAILGVDSVIFWKR